MSQRRERLRSRESRFRRRRRPSPLILQVDVRPIHQLRSEHHIPLNRVPVPCAASLVSHTPSRRARPSPHRCRISSPPARARPSRHPSTSGTLSDPFFDSIVFASSRALVSPHRPPVRSSASASVARSRDDDSPPIRAPTPRHCVHIARFAPRRDSTSWA